MLQRWLGTGLFYCEGQFKKVTGDAEVTQVIVALAAEHAERFRFRRRRQRETTRGASQKTFNGRIANFGSSFMPWSCPHDEQR
jgi:hypothetical protein